MNKNQWLHIETQEQNGRYKPPVENLTLEVIKLPEKQGQNKVAYVVYPWKHIR